ncbi:MAG: hypothetical protein JW776_09255 [Candidatus Lokiarchaeota archaeon]|nr:hypothetical protein [Candidatus Lokiarchaeota archaeon]
MSSVIIGVYTHFLNQKWKKTEKNYLRRILVENNNPIDYPLLNEQIPAPNIE